MPEAASQNLAFKEVMRPDLPTTYLGAAYPSTDATQILDYVLGTLWLRIRAEQNIFPVFWTESEAASQSGHKGRCNCGENRIN